jgi:hypothetical protein
MHASFVYSQTHRALLRSTGHLFKDGRWTGSEDEFFSYKVEEPPALGKPIPFQFPSYERNGIGDFPGIQDTGTFRTCVTRAFDSSQYYGSVANVPLPDVEYPDWFSIVARLNSNGTSFISRNRPGNPVAPLGQFLGELRELPQLPHFLKSEAKKFKDLGSEYLNVEFGWRPFVQDVIKLYNAQSRISAGLKKLVKDNGLSIRKRSKKELTISDPVDLAIGTLFQPFGRLDNLSIGGHSSLEGYVVGGPTGCADVDINNIPGSCDYHYQKSVSTLVWQCGTFRYYVPDIGSDRWTARARTVLSGGEFTPKLIWDLMPWSWLIDWFTNVGDILSNSIANAVENETLTNAFSMESQETLYTISISNQWDAYSAAPFGVQFSVPAGSDSVLYYRKENQNTRKQASPYGFGLTSTSFSARQWAILAALGVSRLRF